MGIKGELNMLVKFKNYDALKKKVIVYVLADISGDARSETEDMIYDLIAIIREATDCDEQYEVMLGVLSYGRGLEWMTSMKIRNIEDFFCSFNDKNEEYSDINDALDELNNELTDFNAKYYNNTPVPIMPLIIFSPTLLNSVDISRVEVLLNNPAFKEATKIGIVRKSVEQNVDLSILESLVGTKEVIISEECFDREVVHALKGLILQYQINEDLWYLPDMEHFDKIVSETEKNTVKLFLPCGEVLLREGYSYEIKRCQIEECSPNEALQTLFRVEYKQYVDNLWNDIPKLVIENKSKSSFGILTNIEPSSSRYIKLNNNTEWGDIDDEWVLDWSPEILVEQDPEEFKLNRFGLELSKSDSWIRVGNKSTGLIIVKSRLLPGDVVDIYLNDKILSLNDKSNILSFDILSDS